MMLDEEKDLLDRYNELLENGFIDNIAMDFNMDLHSLDNDDNTVCAILSRLLLLFSAEPRACRGATGR